MTQSYPNIANKYEDFKEGIQPADLIGAVYISDDIREFNYHAIAAMGSGHLHVEVSINNVNWYEAAVRLIDDVTPNRITSRIPAGSMGILHGKFRWLRVIATGGATVAGAHSWV